MYQFLDVNNSDDLKLIHKEVRADDELENVVSQVQFEIIQAYSQRDMEGISTYEAFFKYEFGVDPSDKVRVRLLGYNEIEPENSDADLKELLKRTIANVASWVMRNYYNPQGATMIKQGQRSISYAGVVPSHKDFPAGWDSLLKNYDARIQPYGV